MDATVGTMQHEEKRTPLIPSYMKYGVLFVFALVATSFYTLLPTYKENTFESVVVRKEQPSASTTDPPNTTVSNKTEVTLLDEALPNCIGKEPLLELMRDVYSGVLPSGVCTELPMWNEVVRLYGDKVIVHGLDTCQAYREELASSGLNGSPLDPIVRVAGLYNSGTNAISKYLLQNIDHDFNRTGRQPPVWNPYWETPWGKHIPLRYMYNVTSPIPEFYKIPIDQFSRVLPAMIIRDPYRWMVSMCKDGYDIRWNKLPNHCPNLVPTDAEKLANPQHFSKDTVPVQLNPDWVEWGLVEELPSLIDFYAQWNLEYLNADFPRLIVRYEDIMFRPKEVVQAIADCVGQEMVSKFTYVVEAAKNHGRPVGMVQAITKYGREEGRYAKMTKEDIEYTKAVVPDLITDTFHYIHPMSG